MMKNAPKSGPEDLKEFLLKNFLTSQEELDQFQQNDEKEYEDEWTVTTCMRQLNLSSKFTNIVY